MSWRWLIVSLIIIVPLVITLLSLVIYVFERVPLLSGAG